MSLREAIDLTSHLNQILIAIVEVSLRLKEDYQEAHQFQMSMKDCTKVNHLSRRIQN